MTIHKFMKLCVSALCLTLACVAVWITKAVDRASESLSLAANAIPGVVQREVSGARDELMSRLDRGISVAEGEISDTRREASSQIALTRTAALRELRGMHDSFDDAATISLRLADYHAEQIEGSLMRTNLVLARTAAPIADLSQQIAVAAPDFLDCSHGNHNCLFERYVRTTLGIEQASQAERTAATALTVTADKLEANVARMASAAEKVEVHISAAADRAIVDKPKEHKAFQIVIGAGIFQGRLF